jgi:hypothetical protein
MGADQNPSVAQIHYDIQELDSRKGGVPLGSRCTALDSATAAITGVTDPRDRAWLLEKVEVLENALRETDLTERLPF